MIDLEAQDHNEALYNIISRYLREKKKRKKSYLLSI
jgi:hypothetical protein